MPWEQLTNIMQENRDIVRQEQQEPPIACPFDGEILEIRADGVRNCKLGNYQYRGNNRLI